MSTRSIVIIIILLLLSSSYCTSGGHAAVYSTCPGNALALTGENLGSARFQLPANCALTIADCSADDISFPSPHVNLNLVVSGLDCGSATVAKHCIMFQSSLNGGSVNINGVSRILTGSADGYHYMLRFTAPVTNVERFSITDVKVTSSVNTASGNLFIYLVYTQQVIVGRGSGSVFNMSGCSITGTASASAGSVAAYIGYALLRIQNFESLIVSHNSINALTVKARDDANIVIFYPQENVTLTGTASAGLTIRGNSITGTSISSDRKNANIYAFYFNGAVTGRHLTFTIDDTDLRRNSVSSATGFSRFYGLYFYQSSSLAASTTTTGSSTSSFSISGLMLSGTVTYTKQSPGGMGAHVVRLPPSLVNFLAVSVSDVFFNVSMAVSGVHAEASVVKFTAAVSSIASITVSNASIYGTYTSDGAGSNTDLQIVALDAAASISSVTQLSITDSHVLPTTATSASGTVTLYVSQFYSVTGSGISVTDCSARDGIVFSSPVSTLAFNVSLLDCLTTSAPSSCIEFQSTVTGGSVDINGVTRTVSGSAAGSYSGTLVIFKASVNSVRTLSAKGLALTLGITSVGSLSTVLLFFSSALSGSDAAGSLLNISSNSAAGTASSTGGTFAIYLARIIGAVSQFEQIEMSSNSLSGITASASSYCNVCIFNPGSTIALLGTAASSITMRSNIIKGNSVTGSGYGYVAVYLAYISKVVSGVSTFTVDGLDMRGNVISASTYVRFQGILFYGNTASLSMSNLGAISISRVLLGGSMSCRAVDATSYGARVIDFRELTGVNSISVTNSLLDFSAGSGMSTSAASVPAIAYIMRFNTAISGIASITVSNASIRGIYSATGSSASIVLRIVAFDAAASISSVTQLSITDSHVLPTTATSASGTVTLYISLFRVVNNSGISATGCSARDGLYFASAITNVDVQIKNIDCLIAASPGTNCIWFTGTFSGGSVRIDGVTRELSGSVAGTYTTLLFDGAMSNMSLTIKNSRITCSLIATGALSVHVVVFSSTLSAGRVFELNNNIIITSGGSPFAESTTGAVSVRLSIFDKAVSFERMDVSDNSISGLSLSAGSSCGVYMLFARATISAISASGSTSNAFLTMRRNVMRGNRLGSGSTGAAAAAVLYGAYFEAVRGSITVDGIDGRDNDIRASSYARVYAIRVSPLSSINASTRTIISIGDVWLGGACTHNTSVATGNGVRVLNINGRFSIDTISVTGSLIDFSSMTTTADSVTIVVSVVSFAAGVSALPHLTLQNNTIGGLYRATGANSGVQLRVLDVQSTFFTPVFADVGNVLLTNNTVHVTADSSSGAVTAFVGAFDGSVSGSTAPDDVFSVSGSVVRGSYTSGSSYACVGIAAFASTSVTLTGFEIIVSTAGVDVNSQAGTAFPGTHGSDSILVQCGNNITSTTTATSTTESNTSTTTSEAPNSTTTTAIAEPSTTNSSSALPSSKHVTRTPTAEPELESAPPSVIAGAAVVAGTSTATSFFAAPSAASSLKAVAALGSMITCGTGVEQHEVATLRRGEDPGPKPMPEPLGWSDNLFGIELGGTLPSYTGAVLSSILVLVLVMGASLLGAAVFSCRATDGAKNPFEDGRRLFRFPGVLAIPASVVGPSLAFVGTALVVHPLGSIALGAVALLVSVLMLVYFIAVGVWFAKRELLLEEPEQQEKAAPLRMLLFVSLPVRAWKVTPTSDMLRFATRNYGVVWIGAVDYGTAVVISAIAGLSQASCTTVSCCRGCSISSMCIAVIHLVVFLLMKPAQVRLQRIVILTMITLSAVMSLLAVISSFTTSESTVGSLGVVASIIVYVMLVAALLSMAAKSVGPAVMLLSKLKIKAAVRLNQKRVQEIARLQHQPVPVFAEEQEQDDDGDDEAPLVTTATNNRRFQLSEPLLQQEEEVQPSSTQRESPRQLQQFSASMQRRPSQQQRQRFVAGDEEFDAALEMLSPRRGAATSRPRPKQQQNVAAAAPEKKRPSRPPPAVAPRQQPQQATASPPPPRHERRSDPSLAAAAAASPRPRPGTEKINSSSSRRHEDVSRRRDDRWQREESARPSSSRRAGRGRDADDQRRRASSKRRYEEDDDNQQQQQQQQNRRHSSSRGYSDHSPRARHDDARRHSSSPRRYSDPRPDRHTSSSSSARRRLDEAEDDVPHRRQHSRSNERQRLDVVGGEQQRRRDRNRPVSSSSPRYHEQEEEREQQQPQRRSEGHRESRR